jgi:hypothetical protein
MKRFTCCAAVMSLILAFGPAIAEPSDQAAISNLLHSTFNRPEAALRIALLRLTGPCGSHGPLPAKCRLPARLILAGRSRPPSP